MGAGEGVSPGVAGRPAGGGGQSGFGGRSAAPPPVVGGGAVFLVQGEIPCLPAGRYFALQGCGDYFTSSIFLRLVKALAPSVVLASMR